MKRTYVNFRELKAAVPIRSVLERYGFLESLRERGGSLSGPCPLCHGESSFRANAEKNCFHCFRCEAGGNMLDLVAAVEDRPVRDAAVLVAEWFKVETSRPERAARRPPRGGERKREAPRAASSVKPGPASASEAEPVPPEAHTEPASPPPPADGEGARQENRPLTFELKLDPEHPWFAEAGLLPETVREFGLGFCSKGMMGGRIAFPVRNAAGELLGYAGLWPGDGLPEGQLLWRYPKGLDLSQVVYPAERLAQTPPGEELFASDPLRVVLCWQLGVKGVFFVPAGGGLEDCSAALRKARE